MVQLHQFRRLEEHLREQRRERVAEEQARENGAREGGESGDQVEGRAPKRARVAIGAPRRSGRHV